MGKVSLQSVAKRLRGWVAPRKGRWRWAFLRMGILLLLIILFRFHVMAGIIAGHNLMWKTVGGHDHNNPADLQKLLRLRGPGARMLVRMGEASELSYARDVSIVPTLIEMAESHSDIDVRANALRGLANFRHPERIPPAVNEALNSGEPKLQLAAIHVFRRLGDESHLGILKQAADAETDLYVKNVLKDAIAEIPSGDSSAEETIPDRLVRVAAIQFISRMGAPEENRKRLEPLIREAAQAGAKIVVLPETAITGYMNTDLKWTWHLEGWPITKGLLGLPPANVAEQVPGPSVKKLGALSKELGIYLTVPILETDPDTGKFYNTLCLVGPDGRLLLHYRKLNPWPFAEQGWASKGDRGLQVIDTEYGRLALLICYDINFEPPRLKRRNVDTLLYSIAWVELEGSPWFQTKLPRLARRNNINIIGANWTVPKEVKWHGHGQSLIIERTGRVLARAREGIGEEILYADLPLPKTNESH